MLEEKCIFCKIIKGDVPSFKVYEDDDFLGILDINPVSKGHTLLIPKDHYAIMPQMPNELIGKMGIAVKRISHAMIQMLGAKGTLIFIANGAGAGQVAPHFILHIIPKYGGEEPLLKDDEAKRIDPSLFGKANAAIRNEILKVVGVKPNDVSAADSGTQDNSEKSQKNSEAQSEKTPGNVNDGNSDDRNGTDKDGVDVSSFDFSKIDEMFKK